MSDHYIRRARLKEQLIARMKLGLLTIRERDTLASILREEEREAKQANDLLGLLLIGAILYFLFKD